MSQLLHGKKEEKKGDGGSASSQTERNWEYPRQKRGPAAKKASLDKLKEKLRKRKQQSIHDPSEEEDQWGIAPSQGELDELAGEGEISKLNGLGNGEFEYVRKGLLIDAGASVCGAPEEDIGDEKICPPEGQLEYSTANAQTIFQRRHC